ncbi:MAG: preprotein translocase subunit SecE [Clostridia bacterium]|nr:preprotein translocase subunit SecE [Clostridia bacterium]
MAENEKKVTDMVADKKETKATKVSKPKKDKVSLGKKIGKAFREFKAEFKKIVWCGKKATFANTALVVVCMVVVATVISLLDLGFGGLLEWLANIINIAG